MKKIMMHLLAALFFIVFVSTNASAWPDGKKEGFLLGFHGGYSMTSIDRSGSYDDIDGSGFHVGPYFGAGLSEYVFLSFRVRYNQTSSDNSGAEYYTTIMGPDLMIFPKADLGLFLNVGAGRAIAVSKAAVEAPWGTVFYGGIGFLITKNVFLSVDYMTGSFDDDMSSSTVAFSVGGLWY